MSQSYIAHVLEQFNIFVNATSYGNGHINDTYIVEGFEYILQRINTQVFKNPAELMENTENVTAYLRKKIAAAGGNPDRETLTIVPTIDGKTFYTTEDGNVFRVCKFIPGTTSIDEARSLNDLVEAGVGFGRFQRLLADFPVEKLYDTIPNFHHTPKRILALKEAIEKDMAGRAATVQDEINFALEQTQWADAVIKGLEDGTIPLRVTHNDTKINNLLFDKETGKAICVIDLDTVMPGSALYDFGDALRIGGSTAAEDETNLEKVWFNADAYKAFAQGFLSEMKEFLTPTELKLLPLSVKLMTYECGIRFLTDYLNGDTYFKIHRPNHNLDRARNQFKLVADITAKENLLDEFIANL